MLEPAAPIDPEALRTAMRQWATGVTIVTAAHQGLQHGMTVSSFTSVSLVPPTVLVSLQIGTRTRDLVLVSGFFGVTLLSAQQEDLSDRFAGRVKKATTSPLEEDRFTGVDTFTLVSGVPLLTGGLAWLDCRVTLLYTVGDHTLVVGQVMAVQVGSSDRPLLYHDRGYRNLAS